MSNLVRLRNSSLGHSDPQISASSSASPPAGGPPLSYPAVRLRGVRVILVQYVVDFRFCIKSVLVSLWLLFGRNLTSASGRFDFLIYCAFSLVADRCAAISLGYSFDKYICE